MRTQRLGSEGPELSVIGFGTWEAGQRFWGSNPPDDQVVEAIRAGLDAGISWIDTAETYGSGRSEELVAQAIAGRDEVFVATKVAPRPIGSGFRAEQVREAAEGSLKRLGVDAIGLLQLHWRDDRVPIEETWEAMAGLVDDGLVRHIGVSNHREPEIERCLAIRHVDSLQPHFSMLHPGNAELIRWCNERGIGVVPYGSLAYGLLTGTIDENTEFEGDDWRSGTGQADYYDQLFAPGKIEKSLAVVDAIRPIAERLGVTLAQLALAWTFHQPGVTSAIVGSRDPGHARQNAEAGDVELDEATLEELDDAVKLGPDFV